MSQAAFHFRRLELRRAPGFPRDGFNLGPLSPGINLLHGPNASGKSTTATALSTLLWPPKPLPVAWWLEAEAEIAGESWRLSVEASRRSLRRSGNEGLPAGLPPPELGSRYLLSLERLLAAEQEPLAAELARESAGGLDLRQAALAAGFRARPSPPREVPAELDKLERRIRELDAEHQRLERQEDDLARLRRELEDVRRAADGAKRLDALLKQHAAEAARADAQETLARFPAWLGRASGDEDARLAALDERLRQAREQIHATESQLAALRTRLAILATAAALAPEELTALEAEASRLAEAERERETRERELAAAEAGWERVAKELGEPVSLARLRQAESVAPARFTELLRAEESLRASQALAARAGDLLATPGAADPIRLAEARRLLGRWLSTPGGGRAGWGLGLLVLAAGVLVAIALAAPLATPWRVAAGAAALALLALAGRQALELRERSALARELRRAGVASPRERHPAESHFEEVARQEAEARLAELKSRLRDRLGLDGERLAKEQAAFEARAAEVAAELGVAPAASSLSLSLLFERLRALFEAGQRAAAERGRLAAVERQVETIRDRLATALGPAAAASPAAAAAALQGRRAQAREAEAAGQQAEMLAKNLAETLLPAAERTTHDRHELLASLGLEPDEAPRLLAGLGDLGAYREAARALLAAERDLETATSRLAEEVPPEPAGAEPSREELAAEHDRLLAQAARRGAIEAQIVEIKTRLADARERHDLEQTLVQRDALRSTLAEHRAADFEAAAGWTLTLLLEEQTRNLFQSQVLERARQIFATITRHRYELRLALGPPPTFGALDRTTGLDIALEALSSGTRVQLLIAVRLASIESQERGLALPLFFDEALTTSDPERSEALMAAICAIARTGRQVFVFTAQPAEVAKWRRVLDEQSALGPEVPRAVLDLAAIRRLDEATRRPLPPAAEHAPPPPPAGRNRRQYGELLAVAALDPWSEDLGGVHLWHLVADPEALHRLLLAGFERWGPAQALLERGAASAVLPDAEALLAGAQARARALAGALAAWRAGQGRPVDRGALAASGAVSETFLDPVSSLATKLGGDAARLLAALERGEVKGFRAQKTAELAASLEEQGFLDRRPRATAEEIRLAAIEAARDDLAAGRLTLADLDDLLASLP